MIAQETALSMVIEKLASIGYVHEGNLGIEGREAFAYSGKEHLQCHHLYVCPENSLELKRHLAFRDYLRSHPDAVAIYGATKMKAAQLFPKNIEVTWLIKHQSSKKFIRSWKNKCQKIVKYMILPLLVVVLQGFLLLFMQVCVVFQ